LKVLSETYEKDYLLVPTDNASWHKSKDLKVPDNE